MDFLSGHLKKASDQNPEKQHQDGGKSPSSSELLSSAKLVADAAQAAARHETDRVDKGKVAGAAADLLGAAKDYGKLDDKSGVGQYLEKAENYLHQYKSSNHPSTNTTVAAPADAAKPEAAKGGDGDSGSGLGDYMKMAQGFLKK